MTKWGIFNSSLLTYLLSFEIFKHRPKLNELYSDHLYTQHLDSAVKKLLLYLLYHIPITCALIHLTF